MSGSRSTIRILFVFKRQRRNRINYPIHKSSWKGIILILSPPKERGTVGSWFLQNRNPKKSFMDSDKKHLTKKDGHWSWYTMILFFSTFIFPTERLPSSDLILKWRSTMRFSKRQKH